MRLIPFFLSAQMESTTLPVGSKPNFLSSWMEPPPQQKIAFWWLVPPIGHKRLTKQLAAAWPSDSTSLSQRLRLRRQIVTNLMSREKSQLGADEMEKVVQGTEGFSGADMTQLCREAALGPIRSICLSDIATISAEQVRPILNSDFRRLSKQCGPVSLLKIWSYMKSGTRHLAAVAEHIVLIILIEFYVIVTIMLGSFLK